MTRLLFFERITHRPGSRSGNAQMGILHCVPSGRTQSAQQFSSSANARPISMVSTPKRSSTSSSTIANCCTDHRRESAVFPIPENPATAQARRNSEERYAKSIVRGRVRDGSAPPKPFPGSHCAHLCILLQTIRPRSMSKSILLRQVIPAKTGSNLPDPSLRTRIPAFAGMTEEESSA